MIGGGTGDGRDSGIVIKKLKYFNYLQIKGKKAKNDVILSKEIQFSNILRELFS